VPRNRRKFSPEFKDEAVKAVILNSRPIAQVARDLGIHREALRQWVRQAEADQTPRAARVLPSDVQAELERLRKEVAELKKANAILKDASIYFATELDPTRRR